jgi:ABC-2 type transport system ATP-binding protein
MVTVENLVKRFKVRGKRIPILRRVSFTVRRNEIMAVIGPNASGKSTLLKVIATIFLPDEGRVTVDGNDVVKDAKWVRRVTSFISPDIEFQEKLTLKETLKFFAGAVGAEVDEIMPFLHECDLYRMMNERIESFSEGQKMLTRLAIALMKKPKLLMLDEPTGPLDERRKEFLMNYLRKISRRTTIMIIDHNPDVLGQICTSFILLARGGRLMKQGSMDELFEGFPFSYTLIARPRAFVPTKFLKSIGFPYQKNPDGTISFLLREKDEAERLAKFLMAHKRLIASFETSIVTWREVYNYWLERAARAAIPPF